MAVSAAPPYAILIKESNVVAIFPDYVLVLIYSRTMDPKDRQLPEPNGPGKDTYLRPGWKDKPEKRVTLDEHEKDMMRPESHSVRGRWLEWHDKPEPHHTYMDYEENCPQCRSLHHDHYFSKHPQA